MSSETITRNDLKAVLDEVLPMSFSLSSIQEVTLPFTAPSNGLLLGILRANSAGRAYKHLYNATPDLWDFYQVSGGYSTFASFVTKGSQVSERAVSNLQQQFYYFVSLGNDALTDYIVEQGTSGDWRYRKWNSGVAECWWEKSISVGGNSVDASNYIAFPFTFTATPIITCGLKAGGIDAYRFHIESGSTSTTQARLVLINTYSGSVSMIPQMYVFGKWK